MERRNFVIGLGGIAASAGLVAGSGAFSQVSADRDMTVQVSDDANAYLSLKPGSGEAAYTNVDADGNIELTFANLNDATGANDNATSWFDALVEVGNDSNSEVALGYEIHDGTDQLVSEGIELYTGTPDAMTDLSNETLVAYDTAQATLEFGVMMDTSVIAADTYTVTITAN